MRRIFYSNINYNCNSNCIFCYSHNTIHNGIRNREITLDALLEYWYRNKLSHQDRVIINGGEPLLHKEISGILTSLQKINCETLVYTNGRLASNLEIETFTSALRFVIPIHGFRELHDEITRVSGSFDETLDGLFHLAKGKCFVDIKLILNTKMISDEFLFHKTLEALDGIPFNHSLHLTKMADTVVSRANGCPSIRNELASKYTKKAIDHFVRKCRIKVFDTCVYDLIDNIDSPRIASIEEPAEVFFKDEKLEKKIDLHVPALACRKKCIFQKFCRSAVCEYTALEISPHQMRITLE